MARPIALLTDYGYTDAFVGVMKGVLLSRVPEAQIFDLTHGVPPQNIRAGALQLLSAVPYCPADTVFVAVVDPGVGSARRPICIRSRGRLFVGPDNGLLWPAALACGTPEPWVLGREEHWLGKPSCTFHGRDVFAPVAAALAMGTPPEQVGSAITNPVRWEVPLPACAEAGERGEVLFVDGFGNCVTNFRPPLPVPVTFRAGPHVIEGPATHYGAAAPGAPLVVLGSLGFYEIAVNGGNAAESLGLGQGDLVHLDEAC